MGNSKGCITVIQESSAHFKLAKRFCEKIYSLPVPLHAGLKSDFRTLHSGISFFAMWSDGCQLECVVSGYEDSLIHLYC